MNHLFTIICEYKGGTYTSQVQAGNPSEAFERWAGYFSRETTLTPAERKILDGEVRYSLRENNLVALEGLKNAWYEGFSLEDNLLEVIIVGTASQPISEAAAELQAAASGKA